ncbi:MAG: hypothetical protein KF760_20805 [Candidatus Eremiobacteraeota bacterium]|nr:hypothetical protein [Candidatus Eremiobacteraeota bacterium]MCW5871560.1 hypothetical protein [Candidatus Eremiobacteraeota bacterium]
MKYHHAFAVLGRHLGLQDFQQLFLLYHFPRVPTAHLERAQPLRRRRAFLQRLHKLAELSLIRPDGEGWVLSWIGTGVVNWRLQEQVAASPSDIPEPRADENGTHPGPPCSDYRPAFFSPGFCWCCRPQSEHPGELVRLAEGLIRSQSGGGA